MSKLHTLFSAVTFAAVGLTTFPGASIAAPSSLCLGSVCLGMRAEQLATLNLDPIPKRPTIGAFGFSSAGTGFGIGPNGEKIRFSDLGRFDKESLAQFGRSVARICQMSGGWATMKASDGQPIKIQLRPTMVEGRSVLVVSGIEREFPPNMSESEWASVKSQVREKYGAAFSDSYSVSPPAPRVSFRSGSLHLDSPFQDSANVMMEQPGCSEKVRRLD